MNFKMSHHMTPSQYHVTRSTDQDPGMYGTGWTTMRILPSSLYTTLVTICVIYFHIQRTGILPSKCIYGLCLVLIVKSDCFPKRSSLN